MKRFAKIVCTIGPACRDRAAIERLVAAGMDVARLNFSHGTPEEHRRVLETIRRVAPGVAIMQDLAGPKIRVGEIRGGGARLREGQTYVLTTRAAEGDERAASVTWRRLPRAVRRGDDIFLADGIIRLVVERVTERDVFCRVAEGGVLTSRKGVNVPGARLGSSSLTAKDRKDLAFGLALGVDYVALSFVRSAADVRRARAIVRRAGSPARLVAKIEKREALAALDAIVREADAVMIARGDLGVEIAPEKVPALQKSIVSRCRAWARPVIVATQMLESMVASERPTRAEASDVANAVIDGADALMLSAETASGQFPVESVRMMDRIVRETERYLLDAHGHCSIPTVDPELPGGREGLATAACVGAVEMAGWVGASVVACLTHSGRTANLLSRHRHFAPIIALTGDEATARRLCLLWGVSTIRLERFEHPDTLFPAVTKRLRAAGVRGRVVLTAGIPLGRKSQTNTVHLVSLRGK